MYKPTAIAGVAASQPAATLGSRYVPRETSLLTYTRQRTWPPCPRHPGRTIRRPSGLLVPARCNRLSCWACVVPIAIQTGEALAMARPTLAVTLTHLPRSWPEIQSVMARFSRTLKRRGIAAKYAYNVEPNPSDHTGAHCHLWWRGDPISQPLLSEIATVAGMGSHVDVRPARPETTYHSIPAIDYGLKLILRDRPEAPEAMWPAAAEYLELNGGRLTHGTHGFWQDWNGAPVHGGVRQARQLAHSWPTARVRDPAA